MAKRALCIGINNYPGTSSDLAGCVNDARDWAAALRKRGYSVSLMLDRQAKKKAMLAGIGQLVASGKRGDSLIIQYSGHGSFVRDESGDEPDGTDECLCPYDIRANGEITDDELFEIYTSVAAGVRVVVFSDSCHSGTVAKFMKIRTPATTAGRRAPQRKVRFLAPAAFLSPREAAKLGLGRRTLRRSSPPGRYGALLMAGCQDTEYSYDAYFRGRPNGAFTFVALQALKSLPRHATYRQWFNAIKTYLPSQQYPQSPNLYGSSSMKRWKALE